MSDNPTLIVTPDIADFMLALFDVQIVTTQRTPSHVRGMVRMDTGIYWVTPRGIMKGTWHDYDSKEQLAIDVCRALWLVAPRSFLDELIGGAK